MLLPLMASADVEINETNFPDETFRDYLLSKDFGSDKVITDEELQEITDFSIYQRDAESLKGIEFFTNLIYLTAKQCRLKELDLSANTKLRELDCNNNQLTSLIVSGCTDLVKLSAEGNQLPAIDLSKNTKLETVYISKNLLTALDLSQNVNLKVLYCNTNQLTSIDLRFCGELNELYCQDNQIAGLELSNNTRLTILSCFNNQLTQLNVKANTSLKKLACNSNHLTKLDVSDNPALITLECGNNQLTSIDVSNLTGLAAFTCYSNQLTSLDVSNCKDLYYLSCYDNKILGKEMDNLIAGLNENPIPPFGSEAGVFRVLKLPGDGNVCTSEQVSAAAERGWTPYFTDHQDMDDRDVWLKYAPSFPTASGGAGTKESPYLIKTADDLDKFAADVKSGLRYINTYFSMDNDIDYAGNDFPSIGNESGYVFSGIFDGRGHIIDNLKCNSGLFASTDGAEISNVTLGENCEFGTGGIVATCAGGSITGCISYAKVDSKTLNGTGGIVGQIGNYYDERVTTITSCKHYGKVSGSYYTGGIVGSIAGTAVLSECINEGFVTGSSNGTGGVVGFISSNTNNTTITKCVNRGTIEGGTNENGGSHRYQTGGIAGFSYGTVSYCDNEGMVRGFGEVGGIVGKNEGIVDHCNNKGDVEANGGIVGTNYGTISNCRNTANVIIEDSGTGAIVGDGGQSKLLMDNYYTENVITSGYDSKRFSGAVSRGTYNRDIAENNGAVLESVTLDTQQQGDAYWTTFFKNGGNYQADEDTKVYTAKMVSEKVDGTVRRTLLLKEVPDRIILGKYGNNHGVLLKSTKDKITLTYTSEAGSEDAYKDNVLNGIDIPRIKSTNENYFILTTGDEFGFSLFDGEILPANTASVDAGSSTFVYVKEPMMGDVTGDGVADVTDVVMILTDFIIGKKTLSDNPAADVNGDGAVDISDIVMLISLIP